ncbi:MAG: hypothetical protein JOZ24_09675 [Candidatus Eremiobacteraeota bacterium]|nr:hypothetical protein [Candidatus Eremiobacteraeota bacterium]
METLVAPPRPEIPIPSCEQAVPGNAEPDNQEGYIGGKGPPPQPLQGGQAPGDEDLEERTGNEGDGP